MVVLCVLYAITFDSFWYVSGILHYLSHQPQQVINLNIVKGTYVVPVQRHFTVAVTMKIATRSLTQRQVMLTTQGALAATQEACSGRFDVVCEGPLRRNSWVDICSVHRLNDGGMWLP